MSEILSRLHRDHRNMSRLLDLLDEQISDLEAGRDHSYDLVSSIIDYFAHYPTLSHHPIEDQVFAWVCAEQPGLSEFVHDLAAEHAHQAEFGREVATLVQGIVAGHLVSRDKIVSTLRAFAEMQRRHIDKEEGYLLKETEKLLRERGLTEIPVGDEFLVDPLFSGKPDTTAYAALLEALDR